MFEEVAALEDPVGKIMEQKELPNGLTIRKVRVPIGVIGIIFESRPNVTADCISLCFKSGNVVILRGGSDAINSNRFIYQVLKDSALRSGAPEDSFLLVEDTSRELVERMLESVDGIDLIMPRGGESLIKRVVEKSRVPVIKHYKGICHVYVDKYADINMATDICINAKTQRPGVCNAMETMLVHRDVAENFLANIYGKLKELGVKILGCPKTRRILGEEIKLADEKDYSTEWLSLTLNVKVVDSLDEAVAHIEKFGSHHSDAIVTSDKETGDIFTKKVDSSAVYINASTRFTDGGEFGLGAEIGISTDKIHARGPMGLNELTTYKYVVSGTGQIRS
jgi:glutamate-5-semialdehyde dehydrogenase